MARSRTVPSITCKSQKTVALASRAGSGIAEWAPEVQWPRAQSLSLNGGPELQFYFNATQMTARNVTRETCRENVQ